MHQLLTIAIAAATAQPGETNWDWGLIIHGEFEKGSVLFSIGPIGNLVLVVVALILIVTLCLKTARLYRCWDPVKATLKVANIGEVEIRPNNDTVTIAYEAWVEIVTRKAGLTFDEQHDVIVEVYDSWYDLFKNLRELARGIPAHRLRQSANTRELVRIMVVVLNQGLRPHLTEWQAKFRRWYEQELNDPANKSKTPQEIQRMYPHYESLVKHLRQCSKEFVEYAEWLKAIAQGHR